MLAFHRPALRCGIVLGVSDSPIGAVGQKKGYGVFVTVDRRPVQSRSAQNSFGVDVRAALKQQRGDPRVAVPASRVKSVGEHVAFGTRRVRHQFIIGLSGNAVRGSSEWRAGIESVANLFEFSQTCRSDEVHPSRAACQQQIRNFRASHHRRPV